MVPQDALSLNVTITLSKAGRVTTAKVEGSGYAGVGCAIRQPEDQDNPAIGEDLAIGRAFRDLGKRLVKDAWNYDRYISKGGKA